MKSLIDQYVSFWFVLNELPDTAEEVPEYVDSVFFEASNEIEEKYRELPLSKKIVQKNNDSFEIDQYKLCKLDGLLAEREGFSPKTSACTPP